MSMKEQKVEIETRDGHMNAFMASPAVAPTGKIRALVVIQEAWGVNHHIEEVCRRFAKEGYVAIAPELFHREGPGVSFPYGDFQKIMPVFSKLSNAGIRTDIGATIDYLEKHLKLASQQIGVTGFCVGGLATMISATSHPIGAAISFYGGGQVSSRQGMALSPVIQDFPKIQCPVLMFFGDHDKSISMSDIQAIEAELKKDEKDYEIVVYPGVGHAFTNDERPEGYNEAATRKAWEKTFAWLKR